MSNSGTVFAWRKAWRVATADSDLGADLMALTSESRLKGGGYGHYEISKLRQPGHVPHKPGVFGEAGQAGGVFGLGSHLGPLRTALARPRTRAAYGEMAEAKQPTEQPARAEPGPKRQASSPEQRRFLRLVYRLHELLMVGLRRPRKGVRWGR